VIELEPLVAPFLAIFIQISCAFPAPPVMTHCINNMSIKNAPSLIRLFVTLLALAAPLHSGAAECPAWLAQMQSPALAKTRFKSLCELSQAFESARARIDAYFSAQGLAMQDPALRLRGVYAPRLVDFASDFTGFLGVRAHGDPWWIYSTKYNLEPTPEVFSKWQDAAQWIDSKASLNLAAASSVTGSAAGLAPLDIDFITTVHTKAFHGLPDWGLDLPPDNYDGFRQTHEEFGGYYRRDAILDHTYDHLRYPVDDQGVPRASSHAIGQFHPLHCLDESPRELTAREEALVFPNGRTDPNGHPIAPFLKIAVLRALDQDPAFGFDSIEGGKTVRRQCGYFSLLDAPQIPERLAEALDAFSHTIRTWYRPNSAGPAPDPLQTVARVEEWLIGIHPFNDGNGRTTRLLEDYLLRSIGLPAPLYWTTWDDLGFTEEGWAEQVALGLERSENILESCADYLENKPMPQQLPIVGPLAWKDLCTVVPLTPSPKPW
jgi:hypothetical protein